MFKIGVLENEHEYVVSLSLRKQNFRVCLQRSEPVSANKRF